MMKWLQTPSGPKMVATSTECSVATLYRRPGARTWLKSQLRRKCILQSQDIHHASLLCGSNGRWQVEQARTVEHDPSGGEHVDGQQVDP